MSETTITIFDVARSAGVSKTTASDALAGVGRVSDRTRQRVVEAAGRLGYVPNVAARHLRRGAVGAVGLYIPPNVMSMAFYMEFAFGAAEEAQAAQLDLMLLTAPRTQHFTTPRVDGLIVVDPLPTDAVTAGLISSGLPLVTVGRYQGTVRTMSAELLVDHSAMTRQLLDHVAEAGSGRPGMITPDTNFDSDWARQVKATYLNWCRQRGITPQLREIAVDFEPSQVDNAVRDLVLAGVDGLICAPDGSAPRALGALRSQGLRVGEDFMLASCVAGRDTELCHPAITAIDLLPHKYGQSAAQLLTDILNGDAAPPVRRTHTPSILKRASTAGSR